MPNYWVMDPIGHRRHEQAQPIPTEMEFLGEMVPVIHGATLVGDEWVCDLCNETMLTRWGSEPWPIPVWGGYAVCPNEMDAFAKEDGLPGGACMCPPCLVWLQRWLPMIEAVLRKDTAQLN